MVEINKELKKLIEENALAFATVDKNGNPHCIAVGFVKVVSKNPKVALSAWSKDWKENCIGYELRGTAKYFTSGKWYKIVKEIPENREEPCKGAILVTIKKIKKN